MHAKYGIPAARYADFAILRGDPSDGLPGVRGVGEKTARDLIGRFASLDELVAAAPSISGRVGTAIAAAAEYLRAMQVVVPVQRAVELRWHHGTRDDARVAELVEVHKLQGSVDRYRAARDLVVDA